MGALQLSQWQFGITTVYHFLFVPITLGTVWLVAGFQTAYFRTGKVKYLQLTKFFGKLFLINFAMGVVTGIVQEFQFGMNWSDYSRFVGDVFGAPLAMEGLLAFFLESTFLGLWIFGWDRLPKGLHLATIWLAAAGTAFSAYFILAANAFMQHPVGFEIDPVTGRAVLNDIFAVLFQNTAWIAFFHTLAASFLVSGALVAGVAGWMIFKNRQVDVFRPAAKLGAWVILDLGGPRLRQRRHGHEDHGRPAADEGRGGRGAVHDAGERAVQHPVGRRPLRRHARRRSSRSRACCPTSRPAPSTVREHGPGHQQPAGAVRRRQYGPGNYIPYVPITYWGFRLMIGLGDDRGALRPVGPVGAAAVDGCPKSRFFALGERAHPASSRCSASRSGWIFTEMGRQPWIVFGQQLVADGGSPLLTPLRGVGLDDRLHAAVRRAGDHRGAV